MTFNPGKSESIRLSRKHNKPYHPPVLLSQTQIAEVNSHKHFGITFSNDCTWHEHLELVKSKAWKRINIIRKLKFKLDRKSLQTIYFSFIRPLLEYADVVWNNCTQYESNELDKIQNEAASIVNGATKLASIDSLHTETGWETLGSRRKNHKLTMFYKMKTDFALIILFLLCPLLFVVRHNTLYVTLQIYKHYIQILVFTIHLSCLLLSLIGMNFQSKLRILQALTSSKTV